MSSSPLAPEAVAASQPTVALTLPQSLTLDVPGQVTASASNPSDGLEYASVRFRITVDAPQVFTSADQVTAVATSPPESAGQSVAFELDQQTGDLVGWWGPAGGFRLPKGYQAETTFDVTAKSGAPTGTYQVTVELVNLADNNAVLASTSGTVTVETAPEAQVTFLFSGFDALQANVEGQVTVTARVADNGAIANNTPLRYRATLTKDGSPVAGLTIKYPDVGDDPNDPATWSTFTTDAQGQAYFGPASGFTLAQLPALLTDQGVTTPFRATLAAGSYTLRVELVDWTDSSNPKTLGQPGTQSFTVDESGQVTAAR